MSLNLKISLGSMPTDPLGADCVDLQLYHNLAMSLIENHSDLLLLFLVGQNKILFTHQSNVY